MGLKICSLASGSSGNCIYVGGGEQNLIVDAGISALRVEKCLRLLRVPPESLALLITHSHSDHISGALGVQKKFNCKIYCHYLTKPALVSKGIAEENIIEFNDTPFELKTLTVAPFSVSHDVPCVGYSFIMNKKKISVATDLGYVGNGVMSNLKGSDLVLLESNHDESMLNVNNKYAQWLKRRILSERGHLSNETCADTAVKLCSSGVKSLILGHLSMENNYPELAFQTVRDALTDAGAVEGKDVNLEVALADRMSGLYEVI